jgi:hypothetical protein
MSIVEAGSRQFLTTAAANPKEHRSLSTAPHVISRLGTPDVSTAPHFDFARSSSLECCKMAGLMLAPSSLACHSQHSAAWPSCVHAQPFAERSQSRRAFSSSQCSHRGSRRKLLQQTPAHGTDARAHLSSQSQPVCEATSEKMTVAITGRSDVAVHSSDRHALLCDRCHARFQAVLGGCQLLPVPHHCSSGSASSAWRLHLQLQPHKGSVHTQHL